MQILIFMCIVDGIQTFMHRPLISTIMQQSQILQVLFLYHPEAVALGVVSQAVAAVEVSALSKEN